MIYREYKRPQSLEEAYTLYQKRTNFIVAGTMWSKMSKRIMQTGIDLCDLGLDYIKENEDDICIGAYTTLHALEESELLDTLTGGAMKEALRHIVGIQFRNTATVGGSIWGRFGFSDVLTLFLALDAQVCLYHRGSISLEEFISISRAERDILTEIRIPKQSVRIVYSSMRNQSVDLPVLTCALVCKQDAYSAVIGARPMPAVRITIPRTFSEGEDAAEQMGAYVRGQVEVSGNSRAGEDYRRTICGVLVKRSAEKLLEETE